MQFTHGFLSPAALLDSGLEHMSIFDYLGSTRYHSYVYQSVDVRGMTPTKRFHTVGDDHLTYGMTLWQVNAASRDDTHRYIKPLLLTQLFFLLPYHL